MTSIIYKNLIYKALITSLDEKRLEAILLNKIGLVYSNLSEKKKALDYHLKALPIARDIGDKSVETSSLNNIGFIYKDLYDYQNALDFLNQALTLARTIGEKKGEITALNNIGLVYSNLGEKQKALEYLNKALTLIQKMEDKSGEAAALNNLGTVYLELGNTQKALEYFYQSLPLRKAFGDKRGEAISLNSIGRIQITLGEKEKALDSLTQALQIFQLIGYKNGEVLSFNGLASIYDDLGEKQKALEYYKKSLQITKQTNDKGSMSPTLNGIGLIYFGIGDYQKALEYFYQALPIVREIEDKNSEAATLGNIGGVYAQTGNNQKALDNYKQSLNLVRELGYVSGEAVILTRLGSIYLFLGENNKALDYFNQSLQLRKLVNDKEGEAKTLGWLKFTWKSLNNPKFAIFYGKQGLNKYQELRQNISGIAKENQKTYLKSVEPYYREIADLLIKQNRLLEAHQVLNSFKDQQFFDFDKSKIKEPSPLMLTAREAEFVSLYEKASDRVGEAQGRLEELKRSINRQPTADENAELQKLELEVKTASDEFLAVLKKAETEFAKTDDEKDKIGEVPDLKEMQAALLRLKKETGQNAAAVYQVVGEENFSALVITPDSIEKVEVPFKGAELNEKALELWALLKSDRYDTTVLSKKIYDVVFAPLEAKLPKDTTTIMWALDGNLRYLPMAALFDGKRFLVERYTHAVFTRADSERMTRNVSNNWTGTGFGSSDAATVEVLGSRISFDALPGVTEELSEIFKSGEKGILTGETFSDKKFSKTNFINALKQKHPLVHIASHFSFRPGDEARSFLLMGDKTAFTLEEMKREENLFQGVELLTLSACNTAAQQPGANGREIDGFAELAQRLGAGAVMATLWQVSDASTPWLMRDFYATRETNTGMSKTQSLQKAQIGLLNGTAKIKPLPKVEKSNMTSEIKVELVPNGTKTNRSNDRAETFMIEKKNAPLFKQDKSKPFAHPYYWSPFVLYGNWK